MKNNHPTVPPACDRTEEIRREAERAIRECETAADLTDRILSQPLADRLTFIDRAEAYYAKLLQLQRREVLVDHFDQPEPKFGDLTDYFRAHREEARREQTKSSHIKPVEAAKIIQDQKKASEPKQPTPNTTIHMTINNYGGTQNIFEAGATQHIERLICTSAPEQAETTNEKVLLLNHESNESSRISAAGGDNPTTRPDGANPQEPHGEEPCEVIFPFFVRGASEAQKLAFEADLRGAVSLGARAIVDVLNAHRSILDIKYRKQTDVHRALAALYHYGQAYDTFNNAMRLFITD